MKILSIMLTILLSFVLMGLYTSQTIKSTAQELSSNISKIETKTEKGEWSSAYIDIINLDNNWKKQASWWPIVLDHHEIDDIDYSINQVKSYIKTKNLSLSLGELSELKFMIIHLPQKEAVNIKNIL